MLNLHPLKLPSYLNGHVVKSDHDRNYHECGNEYSMHHLIRDVNCRVSSILHYYLYS